VRPWEFEIVNNRITGIDVDKLDYIKRDAYYLKEEGIFVNGDSLINETLVLEERGNCKDTEKHRLCYPSRCSGIPYDIYNSRFHLFKNYYRDMRSSGIEIMVADILINADEYFKIKEACRSLFKGNCNKYMRLSDGLLDKIEDVFEKAKEEKAEGELSTLLQGIYRAGEILERLRRREIYFFFKNYSKCFTWDQLSEYNRLRDMLKKLGKEESTDNIMVRLEEIGVGIIKENEPS
jgi:HD superfamily phosphohydrolase